ncbi:heme-NO-binding protein [Rhodovulum imhoffii]|uniref:Heme-NO-binding protein n=1 Tax=Rhodovulum imhoffii TaxID=365340 RepID=A0A2T5BR07_9RHOB|nr:heme NO-binding domain-containing protein [Rhodovulum imhoffii]MBK5932569.1 hypothetical protein [Rhodovulum imhoffii]PTN01648.1 heme-NO-binding protein [Rhodovulum imhoffii]
MYGLINRAFQFFVRDSYGERAWLAVSGCAGVDPAGFEALELYEDDVTERMVTALSGVLRLPPSMLLEDFGTYLVSHPRHESLRRLLRFGGSSFLEFLYSLDDMPSRVRLVLPEFSIPELKLCREGGERFALYCDWPGDLMRPTVVGLLRGMADDYGALVLMDFPESGAGPIMIELLDGRFADGRSFALGARPT